MTETSCAVPEKSLWSRVNESLSKPAVGGALLLTAAAAALVLANSSVAAYYNSFRDFAVGPEIWHLHLTLGAWAADGLLAIYFFVVGLELKEELVAGKLRQLRVTVVPVVAAIVGVVAPACLYAAVNQHAGALALHGWAIPTATDIAFALAVLNLVGRNLTPALRTLLLTLAVVDDFIAISIIAIFYTQEISILPLVGALVPLGLYAFCVQRGMRSFFVLVPAAVATWALVHASGIHATVAGVLLGLVVPVASRPRARGEMRAETAGVACCTKLAVHFAKCWQGVSAGIALPIFAFFSAGIYVGSISEIGNSLQNKVTIGVVAGLVVGKPLAIASAVFLATRLPGVRLEALRWPEVVGISFLAGIGFTVSLLVSELSFGAGSELERFAKVGVLVGSLLAAAIGGGILMMCSRHCRKAFYVSSNE